MKQVCGHAYKLIILYKVTGCHDPITVICPVERLTLRVAYTTLQHPAVTAACTHTVMRCADPVLSLSLAHTQC